MTFTIHRLYCAGRWYTARLRRAPFVQWNCQTGGCHLDCVRHWTAFRPTPALYLNVTKYGHGSVYTSLTVPRCVIVHSSQILHACVGRSLNSQWKITADIYARHRVLRWCPQRSHGRWRSKWFGPLASQPTKAGAVTAYLSTVHLVRIKNRHLVFPSNIDSSEDILTIFG